jgi:hypothetical protein
MRNKKADKSEFSVRKESLIDRNFERQLPDNFIAMRQLPPREKSRYSGRQPGYLENVVVNAYAIDQYAQPPPVGTVPESNINEGME